jgi:hypothetical protein
MYCMYVHIYVHRYVHIYVHRYVHIYVHRYVHIYVHRYVHIYVHRYVHIYVHMYVHIYVPTYVCTHLCTYIGMYTFMYIGMYTFMYIGMYAFTYVHRYVHIYVHGYVCTYICIPSKRDDWKEKRKDLCWKFGLVHLLPKLIGLPKNISSECYYDHFLVNFDQFLAKNGSFSGKCMIKFLARHSNSLSQNHQLCLRYFRRNILKSYITSTTDVVKRQK